MLNKGKHKEFFQSIDNTEKSDIVDEFYNLLSDNNVEVATVKDR